MTHSAIPASADERGPQRVPQELVDRWIDAYLRHAPLSLAVREVNRLVAFSMVRQGQGPVLDVGCGDGFWWTLHPDRSNVYGIDISTNEVLQANDRITACVADISRERPFPDVEFETLIGNCSLEHVPDIDSALHNLRRAAAANGQLVMFVPTPRWAYQGRVQSLLLEHAPRVAMTVSGALNGFFQHWHLYDLKVWSRLLERHGWNVRATYGLGSQQSEFLFRLFMPPAFGQFLLKQVTGTYPARLAKVLPKRALAPLASLVRSAVSDPIVSADSPYAYEYLIVADAATPRSA